MPRPTMASEQQEIAPRRDCESARRTAPDHRLQGFAERLYRFCECGRPMQSADSGDKRHLASVRGHVDELAERRYHKLARWRRRILW